MRDAGVRGHRLHGRQQAVGKGLGLGKQRFGRVHVVMADFPCHVAVARDDIERGAAVDHAGVDGRVRHVIDRVERAFLDQLAVHGLEVRHELAGDLDCIDALRRERGVRLKAAHRGLVSVLALVRHHHLHAGRLSHDATGRLEALREHVGDQATHADAADFFVIAEGQMHRPLELALEQLGHHQQGGGAVAFHVGHAAAIQPVADHLRHKGVGVPGLAIDRHHIGVAGQHQAADFGFAVVGRQGGPQIGFEAAVVVGARAFDAQRFEVVLCPFNDGQVTVPGDRGKGNPFFDQWQSGQIAGLHGRQGRGGDGSVHGVRPFLTLRMRKL